MDGVEAFADSIAAGHFPLLRTLSLETAWMGARCIIALMKAFEENKEASAAIRELHLSNNERIPSWRGLKAVQAAIKKGLFPNLKLLEMRNYSILGEMKLMFDTEACLGACPRKQRVRCLF